MKKLILFLFIASSLFISSCATSKGAIKKDVPNAGGGNGPGDVSIEIVKTIDQKLNPQRPIRIGIMTIIPTDPKSDPEVKFGNYFSEKLIGDLNNQNSKFKIFERKRLELIFKENALSLSGMISETDAKKIGELAPIDAILSGTYSVFISYLEVHLRLIDVVTGEILFAYNGKINLNDDLRALFRKPDTANPIQNQNMNTDPCEQIDRKVDQLLSDLTNSYKIDTVVDEVIKQSYDQNCGRVHDKIISRFQRYEIYPQKYKQFLLNTLDTLQLPNDDYRAQNILRYLSSDGLIDDDEWKSGFEVLKRANQHLLHLYISPLLARPQQNDKTIERIDQFFYELQVGAIGKPVRAEFDVAFLAMFKAFIPYSNDLTDTKIACHVYKTYSKGLSEDATGKVHINLKSIYKKEVDPENKRIILGWICENLNKQIADEDLAKKLYDFARFLEDDKNIEKGFAVNGHLKLFVDCSRETFSKAMTFYKYNSQKEDWGLFCIEHNIDCPALVPGLPELEKQLFAEKYQDKMLAAQYMEKMGARAAPAEQSVLKMLRRAERGQFSGATNLQWEGIRILGNIKSANPKAIEYLINSLASFRHKVPDEAVDALAKIGKPAIPSLLKAIEGDKGSVQVKAVRALGKMGKQAQETVSYLKELYKSTQYDWLKDAIEDALMEIE